LERPVFYIELLCIDRQFPATYIHTVKCLRACHKPTITPIKKLQTCRVKNSMATNDLKVR
jgi:hypothetical protein